MIDARRPAARRAAAAVAFFACVLAGACGRSPPPRGVVLVVVDTLRADHLGCYGYARNTSPRLDALAAEGTVFENAIAPSPWTLPSVATLMTGLYPSVHGADSPSDLRGGRWLNHMSEFRPVASLHESRTTLAEVLSAAGFATAGFVQGSYPTAAFGMSQGFDHWRQRATPGVRWDVGDALAWLDDSTASGERFFVYLHVIEVHAPYEPIDVESARGRQNAERLGSEMTEELERFASIDFDPDYRGALDGSLDSLDAVSRGRARTTRRDVEHLMALYDRQIAYVDYWLGQLFVGLLERGLLDETIVVVTADHGEEFLDHGRLKHSLTYYEEMLHVPLVLRVPGEGYGVRVGRPVGLVDVTPTLLDLLDVPAPAPMQGRSLRGIWRGEPPAAAAYLGEASQRGGRALRTERYKYVSGLKHEELYDLAADPAERENLCREVSLACDALRGELAARVGEAEAFAQRLALPRPEPAEIDERTQEELRVLGYAE